jgi:hypothetical protein
MADRSEGKQTTASPDEARKAAVEGVGSSAGMKKGEAVGPPLVQSTTTKTPAEADKTSANTALDAKSEDPPVRAGKPDTPIAQTLAAGAGAHTPPDPDVFGPDGRPLEPADTLKG